MEEQKEEKKNMVVSSTCQRPKLVPLREPPTCFLTSLKHSFRFAKDRIKNILSFIFNRFLLKKGGWIKNDEMEGSLLLGTRRLWIFESSENNGNPLLHFSYFSLFSLYLSHLLPILFASQVSLVMIHLKNHGGQN